MTTTESRRCSTVTFTTPSRIALPFEHRVEVVTSYEDARTEPTAWEDLSEADRECWSEWLDAMHAQECRRAEMHLTEDEDERIGEMSSDWETMPTQLETILDEIEAAR